MSGLRRTWADLQQRLSQWQQTLRELLPRQGGRRSLWLALIGLVLATLATLVWLAGRYEASQLQAELDRDTQDAISDLRTGLAHDIQALQALQGLPQAEQAHALKRLLREQREWMRLELRDLRWQLLQAEDSSLRPPPFAQSARADNLNEMLRACLRARQFNGPAYSGSYYLPMSNGMGMEVMELCLPIAQPGESLRYMVLVYSLQELLAERLGQNYARRNTVSFTEADGTRLAIAGSDRRGQRLFTAQQLLDLPGHTLVLRMDGRRSMPDLFPNVLTALVTALSFALISVVVLLVRDSRRRLQAEQALAHALAFRKAMEDSLVTGLRARDNEGRITYVNPAFCSMVGFAQDELIGQTAPMPYWPPEMVGEYQQRQAIRLAGNAPPREGYESVFIRKDGTRFPVLIIEAPLISAQGVQTGWMSAILDISEQRRVEELSRASQERLQATARLATVGEMASLLSHELNQPLAAIASYANGSLNLLDGEANSTATLDDVQMALQRIAEQAGRAGRVINSVHDFVRRRDQAREAVAPEALLRAVAPLVNLQARKLGVLVRTELAEKLPDVVCDRTMVEQVLLNLARNGMQAMDGTNVQDRVLQLQVSRARVSPDWLEFTVSDLGSGIGSEVAKQLFTPFFTTKAEGMGLGLSLCRTVIEQHGGHLDHEPNTPQGTRFRFTLPTSSARNVAVHGK